VDAITNAQLFGEPHSNRSLEDWIELVNQLSLRLVHTSESFVWFGFLRLRQALLVIERASRVEPAHTINQLYKSIS
jgi:hypothetical protein